MGFFDRIRKWREKRKTNKGVKVGSEIEQLTNLQMDALKKRADARKSGNSEEAMKHQKVAKDYESQIAKLT